MSEKAKTEALEKLQGMCTDMATCYERLCDAEIYPIAKQALSEPPDVVVLLRWLRDYMLKWGEESWAWNACEPVVAFIAKEFHVRLTADGWKWVDGN